MFSKERQLPQAMLLMTGSCQRKVYLDAPAVGPSFTQTHQLSVQTYLDAPAVGAILYRRTSCWCNFI